MKINTESTVPKWGTFEVKIEVTSEEELKILWALVNSSGNTIKDNAKMTFPELETKGNIGSVTSGLFAAINKEAVNRGLI